MNTYTTTNRQEQVPGWTICLAALTMALACIGILTTLAVLAVR